MALTDTTIVNADPEIVPAPGAGPDRPGLIVPQTGAVVGLLVLLGAMFLKFCKIIGFDFKYS